MAPRIILSLAVFLACVLPAHAQRTAPDPAATVVEDLVVVAPAQGPAWWKATKGDSIVWIMGLPSAYTPNGLEWDHRTLDRRLKGARFVLMPSLDWSGVPEGVRGLPLLPAPTARRVEAALALLGDPVHDEELASVSSALNVSLAYMRAYGLGYDVPAQIEAAAKLAKTPVIRREGARHYWKPEDLDPTSPDMTACMDAILKLSLIDPRRYEAGAAAWAVGDVSASLAASPRDASWVCQHLSPGQWERTVAFFTSEVGQALETPGKVVAAIGIPQLVAKDGILERLRARGYTISDPATALTE